MVLELLTSLVRAVLILHRNGPDTARDPADHGVFRIHAVGKEERQIRSEIVDVHAARQVRLDVGKAVGEREQAARWDWRRPRLYDSRRSTPNRNSAPGGARS